MKPSELPFDADCVIDALEHPYGKDQVPAQFLETCFAIMIERKKSGRVLPFDRRMYRLYIQALIKKRLLE